MSKEKFIGMEAIRAVIANWLGKGVLKEATNMYDAFMVLAHLADKSGCSVEQLSEKICADPSFENKYGMW